MKMAAFLAVRSLKMMSYISSTRGIITMVTVILITFGKHKILLIVLMGSILPNMKITRSLPCLQLITPTIFAIQKFGKKMTFTT